MAWRESIETPPIKHGNNPIPMASRVGNLLFTSGIFGRDPATGELPESVEEQCANALGVLRRVLENAGATTGDVGHVAVYLKDNSTRPLFNPPWVEMYPNADDRPARHAHIVPELGAAIQIQATAVVRSQTNGGSAMNPWRQSIDIPPVMHQNPIPMASRVGNVLFSSGISGRDAATGKTAETIEEQCAWCFKNLAQVLDKAGAKPEHVGRLTVWMRDASTREVFNKYWLEMFPDEHSRPARHAHIDPHGPQVTMEIVAVIE